MAKKQKPLMMNGFAGTWKEYESLMVPPDADPVQRDVMRDAFWAGAGIICRSFQERIAEGYNIGQLKQLADAMWADLLAGSALNKAQGGASGTQDLQS